MSRKINLGIVGLGRAGIKMQSAVIASRYQDLFNVVAGCDVDVSRHAALTEKFPGANTYADLASMLEDPSLELVSVATRSTEHVEHAIMCLEAEKVVFLEKPICLDLAEAKRLKSAAEDHPGKLFLRHNRRFEPEFMEIRGIIASGVLGEVHEIKLSRHSYQRRADWQTIIKCGGGQLNNWGPHIIDHALRLLESPIKETWSDLKLIAAVGDAEDHVNITLKGENGRVVNLEISGGAAISEPTYLVFGSKGSLRCSGNVIELKHIDPKQKLEKISADPGSPPLGGGFGNKEPLKWIETTIEVSQEKNHPEMIWEYLHQSITAGTPFPITLEEGLEVAEVIARVKSGTEFEA